MWYVYQRHIDSGRETIVDVFADVKLAVHKISLCYHVDSKGCMQDEYYYFMRYRALDGR